MVGNVNFSKNGCDWRIHTQSNHSSTWANQKSACPSSALKALSWACWVCNQSIAKMCDLIMSKIFLLFELFIYPVIHWACMIVNRMCHPRLYLTSGLWHINLLWHTVCFLSHKDIWSSIKVIGWLQIHHTNNKKRKNRTTTLLSKRCLGRPFAISYAFMFFAHIRHILQISPPVQQGPEPLLLVTFSRLP